MGLLPFVARMLANVGVGDGANAPRRPYSLYTGLPIDASLAPMRIVHVIQRFHPAIGGAETHVREVAREQARRGHDVTVATSAHPDAPSLDAETIREEDGATYRVKRFATRPPFKGEYLLPPWLPMRGLEEWLIAQAPDLYHAHSYRFHTIEAAAAASRATGIPLVVTAHGFYPPENALVRAARWKYDTLRGRRALAQASRLVAVTEHEVAHYEDLGVDPARVDVVPNGIPESAFLPGDGPGFRKAHQIDGGPVVVFLARLAHDKGVDDLVAAAPAILALHPQATVAFCGRDAGARAGAEALARHLGVSDRVRFLGGVADPRDAYAACDVFVLPSHYEAFGIVLLEAMAQGKPVVATTEGGMPEVVGDAGIIAPARNPTRLGLAIADLLKDPAAMGAYAERGLVRARAHLWPTVVDRLMETYAHALGK